jgi:hypothetical protein
MAKVIFGNHSSVLVPRQDRDSIRKFYCDVLGGKIMKADSERDFIRLGEDFDSLKGKTWVLGHRLTLADLDVSLTPSAAVMKAQPRS